MVVAEVQCGASLWDSGALRTCIVICFYRNNSGTIGACRNLPISDEVMDTDDGDIHDLRLKCAREQLQELEMLQAMYQNEELLFDADSQMVNSIVASASW